MRTTLNIDDVILNEIKELQEREGKSLGRLVSDLLAQALKERRTRYARPTPLDWSVQDMKARVDLADKDAVVDKLNPPEAGLQVSYSIDVNVLLYASDSGSEFHEPARRFLDRCAGGDEILCLTWQTVMGYLRISTHASIFDEPLPHAVAQENMRSLMNRSHVRMLSEGPDFWDCYTEAAGQTPVRGNFVADAHLAALLKQNGVVRLYTTDKDFRKFDFLKVLDPFLKDMG